jgi:hypothetical protein
MFSLKHPRKDRKAGNLVNMTKEWQKYCHLYQLVGGIPTPLKNMSSSVGNITFPIYGKKNVPNHQPDWDSLGYFWRIYQQHLGYLMILAGLPNLPFHEERDSDHGLHSPQ